MFIICRPTSTIVPSPVFTPTISAVSTPIHAPNRFTRMMTKRFGRIAGKMTCHITCRRPAHDAQEAGPDRRERDEVPADPLDADLRQEELRLVLDLADEDPRRRKDHGVDEIERRRELPEADHGADRQHPPSGADGQRSHQTYVLEWTLTRLQSSGLSLMTASRYLKFTKSWSGSLLM